MANNSQYPGIQPLRPNVAPMGPPQTNYPPVQVPMPMQFRPTGPPRPPPPYMPMAAQQFLPVGRPNIVLPPRPGPPPPVHVIVPPLPPPPPVVQTVPIPNNYVPVPTAPLAPLPLTYNSTTSSTSQVHIKTEATSSINIPSFPLAVTPVLQPAEPTTITPTVPATVDPPKVVEKAPSDWIEHTARNGKKYYHNKKTKVSSWEKPLDLMTPIERADASTDWKEFTTPEGRKYYYNKVTKLSKWTIPDELKLAREKVNVKNTTVEQELNKDCDKEPTASPSSRAHEVTSSPLPVAPLISAAVSTGPIESLKVEGKGNLVILPITSEETLPTTLRDSAAPQLSNTVDVSVKETGNQTPGNIEETEKGTVTNNATNVAALEEKTVDQENHVYESKQEAKFAFQALLENANVASDWTWDQAMRVIINDRRYGALRTLSERKHAFNEFVAQKKKHEAEERRSKQRKAREEFKKMLEESKELTSTTKWSKAIVMFEDDDRFKAVERSRDREDLFDDHIEELEKKERSKALEEHKRNKKDYIKFLKSCDFLTASSQWRKVQDRLEADESCLRLEKIDRLEIFQEYIRELEKEEEEQRKLRMEELRKTERKNRDEFRKLMEGHIASGMLTPKSHWRDYCIKVKELPAYVAVSSNTSGATPKDLFEDVTEELEKQYLEDRDRVKEAVKMKKVTMTSTWTLEEFKNTIAEDISSPVVSDVNLKLVFEELQERVREREDKEAKRRKRLADDFYISISTSKEISSSSRWDDFKPLFEARIENWFTVEESLFKEIFDKYIAELKKVRDERKHREDKVRKSADRRRDKERGSSSNNNRKDKRRKDETDSDKGKSDRRDKEKKDRSSRDSLSHRHSSSERKRTKADQQTSGMVEYESRRKRYKRDRNRRGGDQKDAEDGEVW